MAEERSTLVCRMCRTAIVRGVRAPLIAGQPHVARGEIIVWNEAVAQARDSYGEPVREDLDGWLLVHREDVRPVIVAGEQRRCEHNHVIGRAAPDLGPDVVALDPEAVVFVEGAAWVRPPGVGT